MSNTQANNPPDSSAPSDCDPSSQDADVPEPTPDDCLDSSDWQVDVLWDESLEQSRQTLGLTDQAVTRAVEAAAEHLQFASGVIGVRFCDDATIHQINVTHLQHDYPTDVISFPYSDQNGFLEGELVASLETAQANAVDAGWSTADELLLYVIHGVLHIGGMVDQTESQKQAMRLAEQAVLEQLRPIDLALEPVEVNKP